jgi:hypothetical protein
MAIPSGSGTEVLKRTITDNLGTGQTKVIDGVANHIYTVLSIIFFAHTTTNFEIKVNPSAGTAIYILSHTSLAANTTFTFNDKFCLTGTDELVLRASAGECDTVTTFIDQDWS